MADGIVIKLLNSDEFDKKIRAAIAAVKNLRPEFTVIANMWYKDNKQIFDLKSAGQYEDYKPGKGGKLPSPYMLYKKKHAKGLNNDFYPLLKFSGKLEASITNPAAPGAVKKITPTMLVLGTEVVSKKGHSYPLDLQLGTGKTAARPPIINKKSSEHGQSHIFESRLANYMRVISLSVAKRVKRAAGL